MLDSDWSKLKWFRKHEGPFGFGEPDRVDFQLLWFLDLFREYLGLPIVVRCGTQGVHVSCWHEKGLAVDVLIDCAVRGPLNVLLDATRFPFTGIGIYPLAKYDRMKRPVGFHFDCRPVSEANGLVSARWIATPCGRDTIEQWKLDEQNLRRFGVIP